MYTIFLYRTPVLGPQLGELISIGFGGPHSVRSRMILCLKMSNTALPSITRYSWEKEREKMRGRGEMEREKEEWGRDRNEKCVA